MPRSDSAFREFEHQGWSARDVTSGYHDCLSPVTTQAVGPLLDAAGIDGGMRVLDVATGGGYAAAAAAGRGADVTGLDFSETQLELARQRHPDIKFIEGDAGALPFPVDSVDAVISNFGMPHFPDPERFIREAFRVLHSNGRLAFSAWAPPEECVGFGMVYAAVQAHGTMDVSLPPGPSFFMFSDRDRCVQSLETAGFHDVSVVRVSQSWQVPTADHVFEAIWKGTVRAAALLRAQTPEALARIREEMRNTANAHVLDGKIELQMPAVVASGRKP
jgi:SAM-dependent methyltransferase